MFDRCSSAGQMHPVGKPKHDRHCNEVCAESGKQRKVSRSRGRGLVEAVEDWPLKCQASKAVPLVWPLKCQASKAVPLVRPCPITVTGCAVDTAGRGRALCLFLLHCCHNLSTLSTSKDGVSSYLSCVTMAGCGYIQSRIMGSTLTVQLLRPVTPTTEGSSCCCCCYVIAMLLEQYLLLLCQQAAAPTGRHSSFHMKDFFTN